MTQDLVHFTHSRPTRGLLYIGDPHIWSRQPGRRRDASFLRTVLGKLEQAAEIANRLDLWPICPGDLLHDDDDHEMPMLIQLTRTLQKFDRKMICLVGNHDKDEATLSERNALLLMGVAHQLVLVDTSGAAGIITLTSEQGEERKIALGGTHYGAPIPTDIAVFFPGGEKGSGKNPRFAHEIAGVDHIVWMTHDDLAFQGAYPGAKPIHEIIGVDACFNGHMHGTALPHRAGMTAWYNPGNITRMSVDTKDHIPSVWEWSCFETETMATQQGLRVPLLRQHILNHVRGDEIFDLEGRHATVLPARIVLGETRARSGFAERLLADRVQHRTDDGVFTRESLEEVLEASQAPELVKTITRNLQERAVEKLAGRT